MTLMFKSSLPVLDLIGTLHIVDVHANLVIDIGRKLGRVVLHVWEHDPGPELAIIQQSHGFIHQTLFV